MLNNYYGDDSLEELNAAVIMMARIQPTKDIGATSSRSDADILSEVNALTKHNKSVHEHKNHAKLQIVINPSDDDQIDSCIIFDDPSVEDNGGKDEHDSITHDHYNPKPLKREIKSQPKMYNGDSLHNTKLKINSPDSEKTIENAEES
nr:hypothetical protein [Tanacetum cinerariifolium]